jgi:HAD superfamily hydrolase (TIGR01509 family)
MYKKLCVIFDMDGVIIDSEPIHQKCEKIIFQTLNIRISKEEHDTYIGSTDEMMWLQIACKHRLSINIADIIRLKKSIYLEQLKKRMHLKPIQYVKQLITELHKKGFLLVIASSSPHEQINYILEKTGLKHLFHFIISGDDVERGKPNPDIFLKASSLAGVEPQSCIVIEDSNNGIIAAKRANMKCIAFMNPNSGEQDLNQADIIIESFKNFPLEML